MSRLISPLEEAGACGPVREMPGLRDSDRRDWIAGAVGLFLLSGSVAYWFRSGMEKSGFSALEPAELQSLLGRETVLSIGEAHRKQERTQLDRQKLAELLRQATSGHGESSDPRVPISAGLQQAAEADLRAGRIEVVDGWVLSVTEARQCELSFLADRSKRDVD